MTKRLLAILVLLPLVCAKTVEQDGGKKQGRVFSLFSIVTFPNTDCTFTSASTSKGLCLTASECSTSGGTTDGSCAAGFGVCCNIVKKTCGDTVTKNSTYVKSGAISLDTKTCKFSIQPVQSDICQIRLDFVTFVTAVGATGECGGDVYDTFVVTQPTGAISNPLCGVNTGLHMYVENARSTSNLDMTFTFGTSAATTRSWNIKVSQIECTNAGRAPTDCLQYFTGSTGTIQSYNYPTNYDMLQSQTYTICIRKELGNCKIDYSAADGATESTDGFSLGSTISAAHDADCTDAYITIPNSGSHTLYCGAYLSTASADTASGIVRANGPPFTIGVYSGSVTTTSYGYGFKLGYSQVPCS